jgi:Flp pilus assembly protein TadD
MKNSSKRQVLAGRRSQKNHERFGCGTRWLAVVSRLALGCCVLVSGACSSSNQEGRVDLAGRQATGSGPASESSIKAVVDLARHEQSIGDYAGAISFYRRALELDPKQNQARIGLGYSLLDAGSPNEAADTFHKILDKFPQDAAAQAGFAETLLALDQPAAAAERLRTAVALNPDARTYRALGVAEDLLEEFPQAVEDYQKGLALSPDDLGLRDDLGLSQVLAGDYEDGIANLRIAAFATGATARHRQNLALALGLAGRSVDAARVARADLDDRSVESNLAYYALLRGLSPKDRASALLRPHGGSNFMQSSLSQATEAK